MKNRIVHLRYHLGLSQRALAKLVGMSQQHLQRLETNDAIDPSLALARRLAAALEVPLEVVFPVERPHNNRKEK